MSEMDADQIILKRIAQGDLTAFDELYSKYGQQLYVFILRYLRTAPEAEEVLQETFLRLLENQKKLSPDGSLKTWLYTVARNQSLNRLRMRKSIRAKETEAVGLFNGGVTEHAFELSQRWVVEEVKTLSPIFKQMYELRASGQSYNEMANQLGIPVGTVKSRMSEMIRTLKERWKVWNVN